MIASMIVKRILLSTMNKMSEDDTDVDSILAMGHDDLVWDSTSDVGVGETLRGKKAVADWIRKWKEEFPKRKYDVNNISFSSWPFNFLNNVIMMQWTLTQTDKQGKTFKYDGATVMHMKNLKLIHATEYISFAGLPILSDLIEPLAEN